MERKVEAVVTVVVVDVVAVVLGGANGHCGKQTEEAMGPQ